MKTFEVVSGNKNKVDMDEITDVIIKHYLWNKQYHNTTSNIFKKHSNIDDWSQDELMHVALCGVKYMNAFVDLNRMNERASEDYHLPFEAKESAFQLIDALFGIIGKIKLKNLINIFPVEKEYDGDKWECKDYFYTMDVLREKGLDNAVGRDNVFDLMWDYVNEDLRKITIFFMECTDAMYRHQTGKSFTDEFCEENNIDSYRFDKENGILIDNKNDRIYKAENKKSKFEVLS